MPILIGPANNSNININKPTFTWLFNDKDSNLQSGFQWQVDDINDFLRLRQMGVAGIFTNDPSNILPYSK